MKNRKILIVDDEDLVRESIIDSLPRDYIPLEACDGIEALSKVIDENPVLVISDFNMPRMNGREFVKTLKERQIQVPVIWITGRGGSDMQRDVWLTGVYEYIEKPFDPDSLASAINFAIGEGCTLQKEDEYRKLSKSVFQDISVRVDRRVLDAVQEIALSQGSSLTSLIEQFLNDLATKKK